MSNVFSMLIKQGPILCSELGPSSSPTSILQLLTKLSSPVHHILGHKLSCNYLSNSVWDLETRVHFSSPTPCSHKNNQHLMNDVAHFLLINYGRGGGAAFVVWLKCINGPQLLLIASMSTLSFLAGLRKGNFPGSSGTRTQASPELSFWIIKKSQPLTTESFSPPLCSLIDRNVSFRD